MIHRFGKHIGKILYYPTIPKNWTKKTSSRAPEAVFLEKCLEGPVLVAAETDCIDVIGPPDPISNLRPVIRARLINESALQQKLREFQDATQAWNQTFWALHNTKFIKEKQEYIDKHQVKGQEKRQLTADELSEFYKDFLDKNLISHVNYNIEWHKRNFKLLVLAFGVNLEKCFTKFR